MKKILVLDDNPDILDAIESVLLLEGFTVVATRRGEDVMGLIAREQPNLAIMDIMVAGIDGRDLCREIRATPAIAALPIILFSASDLTVEEVMTCGANDFLPKPFDIERLLGKIDRQWVA